MAPETSGGMTDVTQPGSNKSNNMGLICTNSLKSLVVKSGGKMGESAGKYWLVQNRGLSENKVRLAALLS